VISRVRYPGPGWVHAFDEDWSLRRCPCASSLLPCEPGRLPAFRRLPGYRA